jgi:hypothetical protein
VCWNLAWEEALVVHSSEIFLSLIGATGLAIRLMWGRIGCTSAGIGHNNKIRNEREGRRHGF